MPPAKIDSLADDVKPLVLLEQIGGLTARVEELLAQNKALRARIADLEASTASRRRRRTTLRCRRRAVRRGTSRRRHG
jgi:cell division protein FtsB